MHDPAPIFFVSGLPRSGSTLLMNLLGQNPRHYVTPTSGLIELFLLVKNRWTEILEFRAEGLANVKPRVAGALRGLVQGYFAEELAAGRTVFDKSRGWLQFIEPLEECLGRRVRVIVTVRDVRAILASFEKLFRRRSIEYREAVGDEFFRAQTVEGRARLLLDEKSVVGLAVNRLRDAIHRGLADRLVLISYEALTAQPQRTLELLHEALGLPNFAYDPHHVRQVTREDDLVHGLDLHAVREQVESPAADSWKTVLPPELADAVARDYADINSLCG